MRITCSNKKGDRIDSARGGMDPNALEFFRLLLALPYYRAGSSLKLE